MAVSTEEAQLIIKVETRGEKAAERGLDRLAKKATGVEKATEKMNKGWDWSIGKMAGAGAAAGVLAGTMGVLVRQTMLTYDAMGKTAQRLGMTTEALTGLHHAADLTGASTRALELGIQRMTRRISEAANGTGVAKEALEELGLNAQELKRMSPDEAFQEVAEAMTEVETQSDRVRLAFKLFDSEGVTLLNTLEMGKAGLQAAREEMERFGLALTDVQVDQIEAANDAITRMQKSAKGLVTQFSAELSPVITIVANHMTEAFSTSTQSAMDDMDAMVEATAHAFAFVLDQMANVVDFVENSPYTSGFGLLGRFILGKKGLALGVAVGALTDQLTEALNSPFEDASPAVAEYAEKVGQLEATQRSLVQARRLLENSSGGFMEEKWARQVEELTAKERRLQTEVRNLHAELTPEQHREYLSVLRDHADGSSTVARKAREAADALREFERAATNAREGGKVSGPDFSDVAGAEGDAAGDAAAQRFAALKASLRTEEEAVRASYKRRWWIIVNNTEKYSAERRELLLRNQQELQRELTRIEENSQESRNKKALEQLETQLMTREERIIHRYTQTQRDIENLTRVGEERRREMMVRAQERMWEELGRAQEQATDDQLSTSEKLLQQIESHTNRFGREIESAFADMAKTGKFETEELVDSILAEMARLAARKAVVEPLNDFINMGMEAVVGMFTGGMGRPMGSKVGWNPTQTLIGSAKGNVFADGRVVPFAHGGVIHGPRMFPMASGRGLMGEQGPEAVMPLERDSRGRLGVAAQGGGSVLVEVYDQRTNGDSEQVQVEESPGPNGEKRIRIMIRDEIKSFHRSGEGKSLMKNEYGLRPQRTMR